MMSETFCPRCGSRHDPNTGSCPELPLAGRTEPDGLRVLERLSETSLGVHYRARMPRLSRRGRARDPPSGGRGQRADRRGLRARPSADELHRATRIKHPNVANVRAIGEKRKGPSGSPSRRSGVSSSPRFSAHVTSSPERGDRPDPASGFRPAGSSRGGPRPRKPVARHHPRHPHRGQPSTGEAHWLRPGATRGRAICCRR